jgi:hypothetical protein
MSCRTCEICGAKWLNDQLYWSTGKEGRNIDLAALVCNKLSKDKYAKCANPSKGAEGGVGWEERIKIIEQGLDGL